MELIKNIQITQEHENENIPKYYNEDYSHKNPFGIDNLMPEDYLILIVIILLINENKMDKTMFSVLILLFLDIEF
jgi:hypothetical protein